MTSLALISASLAAVSTGAAPPKMLDREEGAAGLDASVASPDAVRAVSCSFLRSVGAAGAGVAVGVAESGVVAAAT